MSLTAEAISKIEGHDTLKNLLAVEFKKSEATIRRWVKSNSKMLTTPSALRIIQRETGIAKSNLLDK